MLTDGQAAEVKKQIISQINSSFPEDKKRFAIQRIESMTNEELETFLAKNNLALSQSDQQVATVERTNQCVFCSIVSGEIDSQKIDENEKAIAVLEINPVSRGHVLVIPHEHALIESKESEKGINKLVKSISNVLKKKLKPKEITTTKSNLFGHETINIIPHYSDEAPKQRHPASAEELLELKSLLTQKSKKISIERNHKKIKLPPEEKIWLPRRIP